MPRARRALPGGRPVLFGRKGAEGPSEASVMARILAEHADPGAAASRRGEHRHADQRPRRRRRSSGRVARPCLTCTDRYHQPRIVMLFAFYGIRARPIAFYRDEERSRAYWRMRARRRRRCRMTSSPDWDAGARSAAPARSKQRADLGESCAMAWTPIARSLSAWSGAQRDPAHRPMRTRPRRPHRSRRPRNPRCSRNRRWPRRSPSRHASRDRARLAGSTSS